MSRVHADHCSCTPDASDVRAQSFVAHSQWGMPELEWLNEHGEPRNHVFEQFFVYLDTYPGMTTSVYDKALKWAQNRARAAETAANGAGTRLICPPGAACPGRSRRAI